MGEVSCFAEGLVQVESSRGGRTRRRLILRASRRRRGRRRIANDFGERLGDSRLATAFFVRGFHCGNESFLRRRHDRLLESILGRRRATVTRAAAVSVQPKKRFSHRRFSAGGRRLPIGEAYPQIESTRRQADHREKNLAFSPLVMWPTGRSTWCAISRSAGVARSSEFSYLVAGAPAVNDVPQSRRSDLSKPSVLRLSRTPQAADSPGVPAWSSSSDGLVEAFRRHAGTAPHDVSTGESPCLVLRVASDVDFASAEAWLADWPGASYLLVRRVPCRNRLRFQPLLGRVDEVQLSAAELRSWTNCASIPQGINRFRSWGCRSVVVTDGPGGVFSFHAGEWSFAAGLSTAREDASEMTAAAQAVDAEVTAGVILAGLQRGARRDESLRVAMAEAARRRAADASGDDWESLLRHYAAGKKGAPRRAPHLALRLAAALQRHPVASAVASTAAATLAMLAAAYGVLARVD